MIVAGAILAGGAGRRMGGPKADMRLADGRTLLECVAAALEPFCDRVLVVGAASSRPDLARLADLRPGLGPLAGIEAALASGLADRYVVAPCDMPRLAPGILARLLEPDAEAVIFETAQGRHPLPLAVRATCAASAARHLDTGERAVHTWLDALPATTIALDDRDAASLVNVNTMTDLGGLSETAPNDRPRLG